MPSESNSAILSLYVYQSSLNNQPLLAGWTLLQPRTEGTGGFAYAVFEKKSTNEIVIAYRGTDDVSDMLTNTGLTIAQERQAAVIAAQYIRQFGAENVSFTGHSMRQIGVRLQFQATTRKKKFDSTPWRQQKRRRPPHPSKLLP